MLFSVVDLPCRWHTLLRWWNSPVVRISWARWWLKCARTDSKIWRLYLWWGKRRCVWERKINVFPFRDTAFFAPIEYSLERSDAARHVDVGLVLCRWRCHGHFALSVSWVRIFLSWISKASVSWVRFFLLWISKASAKRFRKSDVTADKHQELKDMLTRVFEHPVTKNRSFFFCV